MKAVTKIYLYDGSDIKFFGEGPCRLLHAVEETGSLMQAARSMEMAYSKAVKIINNAEKSLGFPLLSRMTGGVSGGGSRVTEAAKVWLLKYEAYRDACISANAALFREYFPEFSSGCVIMASGLGKRFGGNKLIADLNGRPVISYTLDATEGLFPSRVAVTRNQETAKILENNGIETILHDLPQRNDTVRLGLAKVMETPVDGCLFCQADQPFLKRETVKKLLLMAETAPRMIWRPEAEGKAASPVWFPKDLFPELMSLPEGKGGSVLIRKYEERVRLIHVADPAELYDIDTVEDLRRINGRS